MNRSTIKREVDLQILADWVAPGSRILDLGCGRGILLEYLQQTKQAYAVGVDSDGSKIVGCVKRGVPAYQGDILEMLSIYPEGYFDWVLCSRTLHELSDPKTIILKALNVGKHLAIGFVNYGFWLNRLSLLRHGQRALNEVYPEHWYQSRPSNPVNIKGFESFCQTHNLIISRKVALQGDWKTTCCHWPNLMAGYAIYELKLGQSRPD